MRLSEDSTMPKRTRVILRPQDDHEKIGRTKLICGPSRERLLAMLSPQERFLMRGLGETVRPPRTPEIRRTRPIPSSLPSIRRHPSPDTPSSMSEAA